MIVKKKDGYYVLSKKTRRNLGGPYKQSLKTPFESELSNFVYKNRDEALKRLRQVEFFKHKKG